MEDLKKLINFSVLNIDKPSGPTSFYVSNFIAKSLKISKASHMGTLDPMVSGVLPITLGRACRLSNYLMHKDKTYVGVMRLHNDITQKELEEKIKLFVGKIKQVPPLRSSVKRQEREREVKHFKILEIKGKDVLFETQVEAGTYIRKICHDLGEEIGGAHMLELRRIKAGIFDESSSITLYQFENILNEISNENLEYVKKYLIPAEEIIRKILPYYEISDKNLKQIRTGKPLQKSDFVFNTPKEEIFSVFLNNEFIGIYKKEKDLFKPEFVFN